jgi:aprataxin
MRGLKPMSFSHPIKCGTYRFGATLLMCCYISQSCGCLRTGFHAAPSLQQLHLHIISTDFDSPHLTTKKHWISFTNPEFFLDPQGVLRRLESGACANGLQLHKATKEALLKGELLCHLCRSIVKTLPALKVHISTCKAAS